MQRNNVRDKRHSAEPRRVLGYRSNLGGQPCDPRHEEEHWADHPTRARSREVNREAQPDETQDRATARRFPIQPLLRFPPLRSATSAFKTRRLTAHAQDLSLRSFSLRLFAGFALKHGYAQ